MLKAILYIVLALPLVALGQEAKVDPVQKNLLTAYTKMLGGFFINEKCQYLNTADSVAYQQGIQVVSDAIVKAMKDSKTIQMINLTVKQQATSGKNGVCNEENAKNVEALYSYTTQLAYQLIVKPNETIQKK